MLSSIISTIWEKSTNFQVISNWLKLYEKNPTPLIKKPLRSRSNYKSLTYMNTLVISLQYSWPLAYRSFYYSRKTSRWKWYSNQDVTCYTLYIYISLTRFMKSCPTVEFFVCFNHHRFYQIIHQIWSRPLWLYWKITHFYIIH